MIDPNDTWRKLAEEGTGKWDYICPPKKEFHLLPEWGGPSNSPVIMPVEEFEKAFDISFDEEITLDFERGLTINGEPVEDIMNKFFAYQMEDERKMFRDKKYIWQIPWVERVIFNGDATIVFWEDRKKTVVKRSPSEPNDLEKAVLTAFAIKMLGGKVRLNAFMKKALESKTEKTYRWTDICKVRFKTFEARPEQPMRMFMDQVMKSFERFGYISIQKLNDLVISYRILDRNGSGFVMPKHSGEDDYSLAWTNPKDFGIAKKWDKEKKSSYYHIYIRRSPEPLRYPEDWKGEGE